MSRSTCARAVSNAFSSSACFPIRRLHDTMYQMSLTRCTPTN
jgi:hypothetical protein